VKEVDRQLRGNSKRSVVTLQFDSSQQSSPNDRTGFQKNGIRSVQTCFLISRTNGTSPIANCHAKIVNRAVVDRQLLPYSEEAAKCQYYEENQFQIEEATVVPERSSLSLILHELCCSKPRRKNVACKKESIGIPMNKVGNMNLE
jgi:hypothetical protein